jgi:hypothetical protein
MIDIPVYIISLKETSSYDFRKHFSNVNYFKAVDARKNTPRYYYDKGIISQRVLIDLERGRKEHWGFPSVGAIGLILSNKKLVEKLLAEGINENVLICEEDCLIKNIKEFERKVNLLKNKDFDCVVFGAGGFKKIIKKTELDKQYNESNSIITGYIIPSELNNDFQHYKEYFMFTHSLIWSPKGLKKVIKYLNDTIELQLDGLFAFLSEKDHINLLVENKAITEQAEHFSTLGNDVECKLCNTNALDGKYNKTIIETIYDFIKIITIIIIVICILYLIYTQKNNCKMN